MSQPLDPHGQPIHRRLNAARLSDRAVDELVGLARGILCDGLIVDREAEFLCDWLERHRSVLDVWPAPLLYERVREMLADGTLDAGEQGELLDTLHELTGTGLVPADAVSASTDLPLDQPPPLVKFPDRLFCFTGKFLHGTRAECERAVIARGSAVHGSPTRQTDYLVIGSVGSRDWMHSSFGRKIERAVALRSTDTGIAILSEQHWVASVAG